MQHTNEFNNTEKERQRGVEKNDLEVVVTRQWQQQQARYHQMQHQALHD